MKEAQSDREVSGYLSFLLRHHPETAGLDMDRHGWVSVAQLLNNTGLPMERLERIVAEDDKGRYRFNEDKSRIKACQGHSIPWVEPELTYGPPPETLYHGTTAEAWAAIQSARRWRKEPVVLVIDAGRMHRDGGVFGVADNGVWCAERVDTAYISGVLRR